MSAANQPSVMRASWRGGCRCRRICAATLARAHARSGDAIVISSYLGGSESFDEALASFAELYARDYAALKEAADAGKIKVEVS
jgi:Uncharacterized protein conserved in bacteria (DUF2252)